MNTENSEAKPNRVILLADADRQEQHVLRRAIADCGDAYAVHCVGEDEEALRYLRREGEFENPSISPVPELIVTRWDSQRGAGINLMRALRNEPQLSRIPVIVLSSSYRPRDIESSRELGAAAYLHKSLEPEELDQLVATMVDFLAVSGVAAP